MEPEEEQEVDALGREWEWEDGALDTVGRRRAKMRLTWGGLRLKREPERALPPHPATLGSDPKWRKGLSRISLHLSLKKSRTSGEEPVRSFFDSN